MGFFDWFYDKFIWKRSESRVQWKDITSEASQKLTSAAPWYALAKSYIGKAEVPGAATDPDIARWLRDVGEKGDDAIPWCAAFVGAMLVKSGFQGTGSAAARSYVRYGDPLEFPREGCIAVFWRESPKSYKGHVGFFVRDAGDSVIVLSGNQNNMVCEQAYPKSRLLAYRWPPRSTK